MRHHIKGHKIGRSASHRKATLAALSISLIEHKRITTTYPKAKALRVYVEPIIHRAKEDTQHNRRQVFKHLQDNSSVSELFSEIGGKIADRPGGYTRIIKLGRRKGDGAEIAVIELVDYNDVKPDGSSTTKKSSTRRSRRKKSGGAKAAAATAAAATAAVAADDAVEEVAEASAEVAEVVEEVAEAPVEAAEAVEEVAEETAEAAEAVEEVAEAPVEAVEAVEEATADAPVEAAAVAEEVAEAPAEEVAAVPENRLEIESLEGIGPAYGKQFRGLDIEYVDQLLDRASTVEGRAALVEGTSFSAEQIQAWATCSDLFRVDGVTPDFAELLQASGINAVQELGAQDAAALVAKMDEVNNSGEKKLAPEGPPSEEEAGKWISQAKGLDSKLTL